MTNRTHPAAAPMTVALVERHCAGRSTWRATVLVTVEGRGEIELVTEPTAAPREAIARAVDLARALAGHEGGNRAREVLAALDDVDRFCTACGAVEHNCECYA